MSTTKPRAAITRTPSIFAVGDRVQTKADGPGLLRRRVGVVIAVRAEWIMVGSRSSVQAIEVRHDAAAMPVIRPWISYEREAVIP